MNAILPTVRSLDLKIYYFLGRFAGNWTICHLALLEEGSNLLKGGIYFALYWGQWLRNDANRERRRSAIIAILLGAMLSIVAARTVAFIAPFRVRPMNDPTIVHPVYLIHIDSNLERWSAFPSDTAAYFFALAFGLAYLSRLVAIPIVLYTLVWVCLTRVYLGIHYPSDIVAGIAAGIATVWFSLRSNWLQSKVAGPLLGVLDTRPQWFYAIAFLVSFEMATVFEGLRGLGKSAIHGAAASLHLRSLQSDLHRPIDTWLGFVVIVTVLAIATYVLSIVSRTIRGELASTRVVLRHFSVGWPKPKRRTRDQEDKSTHIL